LQSLRSTGNANQQQKLFEQKLAKINNEITQLDSKLKHLTTKKNQNELKIEQCQRDMKDMSEVILKEEA